MSIAGPLGTLLVPAAPARADHECDGVPSCVPVSSRTIELHRLGTWSHVLHCPSNAPDIWYSSWDKSSRDVTVSPAGVPGNHGLIFTVTNWSATHQNSAMLYIGCSWYPGP